MIPDRPRLMQARHVTGDVARLAGFYAALIGIRAELNDYYIELPAGPVGIGFSRHGFTEDAAGRAHADNAPHTGETILDFLVEDVDAQFNRIDRLDVDWILPPTTQPWGTRCMMIRDCDGHLVNILARDPHVRHRD
jgi:hypothetical protein